VASWLEERRNERADLRRKTEEERTASMLNVFAYISLSLFTTKNDHRRYERIHRDMAIEVRSSMSDDVHPWPFSSFQNEFNVPKFPPDLTLDRMDVINRASNHNQYEN